MAISEMRVYNLAPFWDPSTRTENPWKRWATILEYGWGWYQEYKAQNQFLDMLRPLLDRRFIAIRNYVWPEVMKYPFPIILLGPPGVYLLYVTPLRGEFRIQGDRLLELGKGKGARPVKPDLVYRTKLLSTALEKFIAQHGGREIPVQSRLVFIAPDVYVDSVDAEVQPLLLDGIHGFAENLLRSREQLSRGEIRQLTSLFLETEQEEDRELVEGFDDLGVRSAMLDASDEADYDLLWGEEPAEKPKPKRVKKPSRRIAGLTPRQWLIVAVLVILNILFLVVLILLLASPG